MDKRKREILALALLVLLGVIVVSSMAWYILVGHNWNKAASHIDDLVGSMEGYTVIVYEGVVPQPKQARSSSSASAKSAGSATSAHEPAASSSAGQAASAKSAGSATSASTPAAPSAASQSAASKSSTASRSAASSQTSKSSTSAKSVAKKSRMVSLKKVIASYQSKGASVITLHLKDLSRYDEPFVVSKGGKRIGLCSMAASYRYAAVRAKAEALVKADAETVIMLANDASFKKGLLRNVDIVVLARNARVDSGGRYYGSTFFVDSPYVGEVQAIIISPSGTIISKTITSL